MEPALAARLRQAARAERSFERTAQLLAKHAAQRFQNCREVISALALMANITEVEDIDRTAIIPMLIEL